MAAIARALENCSALRTVLRPFAQSWVNASGYRRLGLLYDDLIIEENPEVTEALRRVPNDQIDARYYRIKRAFQCDLSQIELPPSQWTKPEEDVSYLLPILEEVEAEVAERNMFNSLKVVHKK
ncbi:Cytochrome b-c1 complex subunit 7 [Mycoemilia scoparia]|uniref:Cytochrome b-c1 complex subunit 7 n=1 Tax=Mycoemilia scoparia TaxID=417184 RepID=A0A9W7ZXA9_9FUNG|nr:Cytochrome b-c1 complex subunit 7 [Mycoemilia scoparia]